jgi:hypothetical protein
MAVPVVIVEPLQGTTTENYPLNQNRITHTVFNKRY